MVSGQATSAVLWAAAAGPGALVSKPARDMALGHMATVPPLPSNQGCTRPHAPCGGCGQETLRAAGGSDSFPGWWSFS